jgi:ribonuclease III
MEKKIDKLMEKVGVQFTNKDLLTGSMVHRSYINEHPSFSIGHNERMEFLGDAVLELVVTEYLYENYDNPEGELTNWRAALVNSKSLAEAADELGVYDFLYLSRGEAKDTNPKARSYILANAFEALIGAIFLDQGWDASKKFITDKLIVKLPHILKHKLYMDAKSHFQEMAQEHVGVTPNYKVSSESGPDHAKDFVIGIYLEDELVAEGKGTSKQEAQMDAARNALEAKGW